MRKGLTKTLAAIAIACLGYQAYAIAPVINSIPSPIVTDDGSPIATASNLFVYADALNLNNYVSDDGDLANIIWSFTGTLSGNSSRYSFNGATPLNILTDNIVTPPLAKTIAGPAVDNNVILGRGEYNPDNNPVTATIRDVTFSPILGPEAPPAAGTMVSELVSLYASDGTTRSLPRSFLVYTQQGGTDRLTQTPAPTPVPVRNTWSFASVTNGWYFDTLSSFGSVTRTNGGTPAGLCMTVTAGGVNVGQWVSPYGTNGIPYVNDSVWRLRATMSTNQATAGLVPLWDIFIQNLDTNPATGAVTAGDLAYTSDYMFLDNAGNANAIKGPAQGLNQFDIWYTPAALRTPKWRNSAMAAPIDALNDMRVIFRVLDVAGAGYGGELDSGQICLQNMAVDRFDLSKEYTAAGNPDVYNLNPIIPGINGVSVLNLIADQFGGGAGTGAVLDYSVAPLTITPADPLGWLTEITEIRPGDTNNPLIGTSGYDVTGTQDNYPIPWTSNTLYEMLVDASAPDAAGETNGPDCLLLGFSAITNEILGDSYMLSGLGRIGMPVVGDPQTYTMLWWGHNPSGLVTPAGAQRLSWHVFVLNSSTYDRPNPVSGGSNVARNLGGIRIHSVKVRKVGFLGM